MLCFIAILSGKSSSVEKRSLLRKHAVMICVDLHVQQIMQSLWREATVLRSLDYLFNHTLKITQNLLLNEAREI